MSQRNIPKPKLVTFFKMIKIEHSIFALPFAYLGMVLAARGWPGMRIFLLTTLAMVSFRTMGMSLNRLIDRAIDAKNPRTKMRAIPSGRLQTSFVWGATLLSWLLFEGSAYALGSLCFQLSPIPVFFAFIYPWMKRFSWLSHFVLGTVLGIAPYGAWIASGGALSWIPGLFSLGVIAWVAGFDIIYALQDFDFDRDQQLHSVPSRFGCEKSLQLTRFLHGISIILWTAAGVLAGLGGIYFSGLILVSLFLIWENWLVKKFGTAKIQQAFFQMNAVVSLALFVAVICDFLFVRFFA